MTIETSNERLIPFGMGIDRHCSLFKAPGKVIRAIKPEHTAFYEKVLENKAVQDLIDSGMLIPAKKSDIQIAGHELVFEHPLLPAVSYPFEWTPSMYKDAAISLLKLNLQLMKENYCVHDAHPWNLLFNGTRPVFVDFTSIIKSAQGNIWQARSQFIECFLNPLLLMQAGFPTTARQLLREIFLYPDQQFIDRVVNGKLSVSKFRRARNRSIDFAMNTARKLPQKMKTPIGMFARTVKRASPDWLSSESASIPDIERLLERVEAIDVRPKPAEWSGYYCGTNELPVYDGKADALAAIRQSTPKHSIVCNILERIYPESVLDLGCNRGLYAQFAAMKGARAIGVDMDERALDDMYLDSKKLGSNVMPLYINAVAPAEAIGLKEMPFPTVTKRLRSQMVLCLALVHHLVFKMTRMKFWHIAQLLDSYSEKYLLVEFIPREDPYIQSWITPEFDWYTLENFKAALHKHFSKIEVFESYPSPRILLFCEKD